MDRISPTDPPDEPVNRVAAAMARKEGKVDWALGLFSPEKAPKKSAEEQIREALAPMREGFAALLAMYHAAPEGDHQEAAVQFAKELCEGPQVLLAMLRTIAQRDSDHLAEFVIEALTGKKDFTHHAAIVPLIIRDLEKSENGFWTAS